MDFALTEEQEMLRRTARDFIDNEVPKSLVRQLMADEKGYSAELWRKMAELGWVGLVVPEQYEGMGGNFIDLIILLEEMGRGLVPSPFFSTAVLCTPILAAAGSEAQKQEVLAKVANGDAILALALLEPSASYDPANIQVKAVASGGGYVINGTKLFVSDAHVADYLIVAARTKEGTGADGITLFLVDAKSPGVNIALLKTISISRECEVELKDVKVAKEAVIVEVNGAWPVLSKVLDEATVALCTMMVGGAQKVLDMTVDYAKQRVQFGRPIGSFQAIQHKCANVATDLEGARAITYAAASRIGAGEPAAMEVSMAKTWTSDAFRRACAEGHQCHGAIGFTWDHDMHLYTRFAKVAELQFGDANIHREKVAQLFGM